MAAGKKKMMGKEAGFGFLIGIIFHLITPSIFGGNHVAGSVLHIKSGWGEKSLPISSL